MATLELVRFLSESADELIKKAESTQPGKANEFLDEAEELLALGALIMARHSSKLFGKKEAA